MKRLSILMVLIFIFGLSVAVYASDECPLFQDTFERSTKKPETRFETFQCLSGEAILKIYNGAEDDEAIKVSSATISINGNEVVSPSSFNQNVDYIETIVDLNPGENSLEVLLKSKPGGKIKIVIVESNMLASGYTGVNGIGDMCYDDGTYPDTFKASISVGKGLYGEMAVSPDGKFVYVTNFVNNNVYAIQVPENIVSGTIAVGRKPFGVSVTPDGRYVYVSNYQDDTVSIIETSTNTEITNTDTRISVGNGPFGVSVTPDGKYVYVCNYLADTVSVIQVSENVSENKVIATIDVGDGPFGISISPNGCRKYAYVSNYLGDSVSVIQVPENTLIADIEEVGDGPHGVSVTPDGQYVYVSNFNEGTVSVIETSTNTKMKKISVGNLPHGISVTPCGDYVYVNNYANDTVSVIQIPENTWIADIEEVGDGPHGGIAVSPNGENVYVGSYWDGKVSVIGY